MILDRLEYADRYAPLAPGLDQAFQFLRERARPDLAEGRHEIDGSRVYALVQRYETHHLAATEPEAHRQYLDVQYLISGEETILWIPLSQAGDVSRPYDPERDIEFFYRRPGSRHCHLGPGLLAIFFPTDAHQPGCNTYGPSQVHKVVVKVRL